jgi:hypothetical protein
MPVTKDNLTIKNIKSYIRAKSTKIASDSGLITLDDHFVYQVLLRTILCSDCLNQGFCQGCTCDVPDLFYDKHRTDSLGRWGAMLDEKEFNNLVAKHEAILGDAVNTISYNMYNYKLSKLYSDHYKTSRSPKGIRVINIPIENTNYDFGELEYGSEAKHVFTFLNTSDIELSIQTIVSSCGCTIPIYKTAVVKPNDEYSFEVSYDTTRVGKFSKNITISVKETNALIPNFNISGTVLAKTN